MHIWHGNAEQPAATRKSKAPVSKLRRPPPVEHATQLEEGVDIADTAPFAARPKQKQKRKRKHGNDSVSCFLFNVLPTPKLNYRLF